MKLNLWNKKVTSARENEGGVQLQTYLAGRTVGQPLRFGDLTMIPVFGTPDTELKIALPETDLSLTSVRTYGEMHLNNKSLEAPAIVPLHLGYFQQGAQNHAMCTSWVLEPGEERLFDTACCIQAAQGGYIMDSDDRFIILPHQLRAQAHQLREQKGYSKLWNAIATFNQRLGLKNRGHLDEMKQEYHPVLVKSIYQLERQNDQTGAIFLYRDQIAGIELAPNAAFWGELHRPLVMYCYTPLTLEKAQPEWADRPALELDRSQYQDLNGLADHYRQIKQDRLGKAKELFFTLGQESVESRRFQRYRQFSCFDLDAGTFKGQGIWAADAPVYLSMFNTALLSI